jgi:hypothetical protein
MIVVYPPILLPCIICMADSTQSLLRIKHLKKLLVRYPISAETSIPIVL